MNDKKRIILWKNGTDQYPHWYNASQFANWIRHMIRMQPKEYRSQVKIKIHNGCDKMITSKWKSVTPIIEIYYDRDFTNTEMAQYDHDERFKLYKQLKLEFEGRN